MTETVRKSERIDVVDQKKPSVVTLKKLQQQVRQLNKKLNEVSKVRVEGPVITWIPLTDAMVALGKKSLRPRFFERGQKKGQLKFNVGDKVPMSYATIMKMLKNDPSFELKKLGGNYFITKYPEDFARQISA